MIEVSHLVDVADAYALPDGLASKTVSNRVFRDSKKLDALRCNADITISRFNDALLWFSQNWPADADWPEHVHRPDPSVTPLQPQEA